MTIENLQFEHFEPHVGDDFVLPGDDTAAPIAFKLVEATRGRAPPEGFRHPFQLVFRVPTQTVFEQGNYLLTHPTLGENAMFLVPIGQTEAGTDYCATFS